MLADGSANGVGPHTADPWYRVELGIPGDAVVVTFAGRITRDKGIRELVAAWREVADRHPEAPLVVAGRSTAPARQGRIEAAWYRCRGPTSSAMSHLTGCGPTATSACCRATARGFLVVIEAAAAGVPAVVCDFTGGRERVRDGETGRVVPRRDAAALAARLERSSRTGRCVVGSGTRPGIGRSRLRPPAAVVRSRADPGRALGRP